VEALAGVVKAVGDLMASSPDVREIDLNPVLVHSSGRGVTAVDVRIAL